jgi:hypothetical protein
MPAIEVRPFRRSDRDQLTHLDYAWLEGTDPGGLDYADYRAFLSAAGFRELTRTRRGWSRSPRESQASLPVRASGAGGAVLRVRAVSIAAPRA